MDPEKAKSSTNPNQSPNANESGRRFSLSTFVRILVPIAVITIVVIVILVIVFKNSISSAHGYESGAAWINLAIN